MDWLAVHGLDLGNADTKYSSVPRLGRKAFAVPV